MIVMYIGIQFKRKIPHKSKIISIVSQQVPFSITENLILLIKLKTI